VGLHSWSLLLSPQWITCLDLSLRRPESKLSPKYLGPYKVIRQYKNDVEAQHLCGAIETFHVSMLKPYFGSHEQAVQLAMCNNDQELLFDFILQYRHTNNCNNTQLLIFIKDMYSQELG
jgi:hypothetical protein